MSYYSERYMKTEFKGVYFNRRKGLFSAQITIDCVTYPCGTANTARAAAILRDRHILSKGLENERALQVLKPVKK